MSSPHATPPLFQMFGRDTASHVDCINRAALETLRVILLRPLERFGLCTLLRAPRAGYGKSHLLCRLQQELRGSHEFVLLHAADGNRFDASACLENVLSQLTRALPGGAGLTPLDLLARKLFALGLEPLVRSGEVPCQDRDSALHALSQRPTETFDFHHPSAATAHWAREHFEVLGPRLIVELSQMLQTPMRDISFWVEVLFRYAATPPEYPSRLSQLLAAIATSSPTAAHDRLAALLHILSQWQRIVLVVDELEGLSANPEAALRLATFLTTLRHGAERIDVILSVNDDIWESAFIPRLSGGLIDRLTESVVHLAPLTEQEALALLQSLYPNANAGNLQQLGISGDLYARAILRAARTHGPLPVMTPQAPPAPAPLPVAETAAAPEPPAASAPPAGSPFEIAATPAPPVASPFQIEAAAATPTESFGFSGAPSAPSGFSPFTPEPEPTEPPAPVASPSAAEDGDRVNELLRQFRERYGNP